MRYIGIDFGTKNIGLAISDESGAFAMPHKVVANTDKAISEISDIISLNHIAHIVMGESLDSRNQPNAIMPAIREFAKAIQAATGKTVLFEPEFFSSQHAEHFQGAHDMLDASAAAIILQRHLDRETKSA